MTSHATIALVTGANKGIGLATVRRLAALGWTVWLGSRDERRGKDAAASVPGDVRPVVLDVTDDASVAAARDLIESELIEGGAGRLDVLINNAGIGGRRGSVEQTTPADFLPVYGVNVLGPVRVLGAFLPLLHRSDQPRVVMVSSGMGSFGITTDPDRFESTLVGLVYPSSKSALNMITTQYAKGLPGFQVNAVDPGYTATDLNAFRGTQTVEQAAEPVVRLATLPPEGPTGGFFGAGGPLPW
jgi:NAD(P)-dependent dehydrogenase (short-subunit alcohol dehydrogenase family)